MRSGAPVVAAGFAQERPLALDITRSRLGLRVVCHVLMLESRGVDSALARVALLDTDLLTVPLLP